MPLTDSAPYAPSASVIRVLQTYRDTGLGGGAITSTILQRFGFGDEIVRRILQSLTLLGLIDDGGVPTQALIDFKLAPSHEFKTVLRDILLDAYAPVFAVTGTDLASKTVEEIENAFRQFKPDSLRKRMVTLFLGLAEYAGMMPERTQRATPPVKRSSTASSPQKRKHHAEPPPAATAPEQRVDPLTEARKRYIDLLIAKAEESDAPPDELLDRIERALGLVPNKGDTP